MVRPPNVARSRACNQCKRKRIKCDLRSPSCQRCIESGITCSGPLSGLLMVNASSASYGPTPPRPRRPSRQPNVRPSAPSESSLIIPEDPSPALIYEDTLLWTFLSYFTQKPANEAWSSKLPQLRVAKNAAAMKSAAKAVSLAFAARNLNNMSMAATACEYYGESLRLHQFSFVGSEKRDICSKKAVNALPVTVLLSYFEMIQPTSADAWLRHTAAAERLLVLLGPRALNDDLLNHLYFIVKSNSVTRCFMTGTATQLFGQIWQDVSMKHLCGYSTLLFNRVVDILAHLSDQFAMSQILPPATSSNVSLSLPVMLDELTAAWKALEALVGLKVHQFPFLSPDINTTIATNENELPQLLKPAQSPSTSMTAAFFHAASVMILTLLQRSQDLAWSNTDLSLAITYHATQILSCCKYLITYGIGCSCLRMMLPITAVHRLSPHPQQRLMAKHIFQRWSSQNGLAGLSRIAFGEDVGGDNVVNMSFMDRPREYLRESNLGMGKDRELDDTLKGGTRGQLVLRDINVDTGPEQMWLAERTQGYSQAQAQGQSQESIRPYLLGPIDFMDVPAEVVELGYD